MNSIAKTLARDAKKKGICEEWHKELLRTTEKEDMIRMYIRGIDFCIANNYPSHDYMRQHFKGVMEQFGVFLDDTIDEVNPENAICHGTTSGSITFYGYATGEVIVKDKSEITISVSDNAFVMVDIFDDAVVDITASDEAKVCVNRYAGGSIINTTKTDNATIKEVRKVSKTYVSRG